MARTGQGPWKGSVETGITKYEGPRGEHWFRVQMGTRRQRAQRVVKTLADAVALKTQWLREGLPRPEGTEPEAPPEPRDAVEDALKLWIKSQPVRVDPASTARRKLDKGRADGWACIAVCQEIYPALLHMPVERVAPEHFGEFFRLYTGKEAGAATYAGILRAAIRLVRPSFTVGKGVFPRANLTRHKMLTETQLRRMLLALPEPLRTMADLARITLMRMSEIRLLTRDEVNLTTRTITKVKTKTGPDVITLGEEACALLARVMESHTQDYLFPRHPRRAGSCAGKPYTQGWLSELFHTCMVKIGLGDFHFHDLRHHGAMIALHNGASFPVLQALGRWQSPTMVMRYAQPTDDHVRRVQDSGARFQPMRVAERDDAASMKLAAQGMSSARRRRA